MKKERKFIALNRIVCFVCIGALLIIMGLSYACSDEKCKICTNEQGDKEEFCGSELEDIEKLPGSNCR